MCYGADLSSAKFHSSRRRRSFALTTKVLGHGTTQLLQASSVANLRDARLPLGNAETRDGVELS
jgi:hypothetical protein